MEKTLSIKSGKLDRLNRILRGEERTSIKDAECIWHDAIRFSPSVFATVKLVQATPTPYVDVVLLKNDNESCVCEPEFHSVEGSYHLSDGGEKYILSISKEE